MIFIKQLISILGFIMSNDSPKQMGWGISLALLYSLMPGFNLIHLLLFVFVYLVRVHLPSFLLFAIVFKIFNNQALVLVHHVGYFLLSAESLKVFWTTLYNLPIVPFTKFYNTSVLGGLVVGIILLYPTQLLFVKAILYYRKNYQSKINNYLEKSKIVRILKTSKIYQIYLKYHELRQVL